MKSKYEIEEALTPEEIRSAETLWVENLDIRGTGQEKYQWYYQENPCGQGQIWLMRDGNTGKVIGTGGLGNRTILVGGKRLRAGLLADLAICKTHRLLGP
ncbi:MAG: GNAT family N-acetyltransferase, partial [Desulfomonile tiedjei]|nr:GNAT family N-acetyltransferase [Desulfomonile tiedjei]